MYKYEQFISAIKLLCLTCLLIVLLIGTVNAVTFTVGSSADSHDLTPGDGKCLDSLSRCTLRAAVEEANAYTVHKGDTILFNVNLSYQTITLNSSHTDIDIRSNIVIDAAGMVNLSVSGNNAIRVFSISGDNSVTLRGFTIRNGQAEYDAGGAILAVNRHLTLENIKFSNNYASKGGGVFRNSGLYFLPQTTIIRNSTFDDNDASNGGGGYFGGIGTYAISGGTFSNNTCGVGCGFVVEDGVLTMVNSTITGNYAFFPEPWFYGIGSAIFIYTINPDTSGMKTLRNVTVSANASYGGSGIHRNSDTGNLTLANTIIANDIPYFFYGNQCVDVCGPITSLGNNLVRYRSQSSGYIASDLPDGTEPMLGQLLFNGGTTKTLALLAGSPAIDAGNNLEALNTNNSTPLTTDQRGTGYPRISNAIVAIGAYESPAP